MRPSFCASSSASFARSASTSSGLAFFTKLSFDNLPRSLPMSLSFFLMTLVSRSISAAASMIPAMGTSSVVLPTMALAETGSASPAPSSFSVSRPARRNR